jgi:DNA-binding MarR family transcriptional regulator
MLNSVAPEEDPALRFRMSVIRLARRIRQLKVVDEVTDAQMTVAAALYDFGPATPGELADREGVSPPAINRTVNALTESGYVRRVPDPGDGRRVFVEITDAGRDLVAETRRRRNAWMEAEFAGLTDADRAVLARAAELMETMGRR